MTIQVLYVITKASWGGAQRYVYDLATAARDAGYEVAVAYGEAGELVKKLSDARVRSFMVSGLSRDMGFFREFAALVGLVRLYRRDRPDVVHINSSKAGILGALAARIAGVPRIVFTSHGWAFNEVRPWWQRIFFFAVSGIIVSLSHETLCNSHATYRDIRRFPFIHKKLRVITLGIECPMFLSREAARAKLAPPSVGKYWIGMISELHPTKRVSDAIYAMDSIAKKYPDTLLVVIGSGQEREALENIVRKLRLQRHVFLAGFRDNAAELLKAFDLFIHTSVSESLGYAILEAGYAGLPVVATRAGGIPEIIPNDDYGLLVPPLSPEALAQAIESLMRDSQRAMELGARLRARVQNSFSKERMITETLKRYLP